MAAGAGLRMRQGTTASSVLTVVQSQLSGAPDGGTYAVALAEQLRHEVRRHEARAAGHDGNVADWHRGANWWGAQRGSSYLVYIALIVTKSRARAAPADGDRQCRVS